MFRKPHRHDSGLADDRERAFPDLLFRVLRDLANPVPPARLNAQILQRSLAFPANSERNTAMTAQPVSARTHNSTSNLFMFTPLDATGGRGMSRSSVACALAFNAALIAVLGMQVHHRVFVETPHTISLVAPVEKLPEPVRPRFTPKVIPLKTATVLPNEPVVLRHAPEPMPAPVAPMPLVRHDIPVATVSAPIPNVVRAAAAPTVHTIPLATTPVTVQPSGPAVATVNLARSGMPGTTGVPGVADAGLRGLSGPAGRPSVGTAGPVHLPGCSACPSGNSDRNSIPKPIESRPIAPNPHFEATPTPTIAQTPSPRSAPIVLFKPKPNYTPEATSLRIEGTVKVRIRVSAGGTVTVLGVPSGLGHGLDESAIQCAQGIRFKPAVDAAGKPVDWEGVVSITFQIA